MKLVSVVAGCFNEAENIEEFVARVRAVFEKLPQYRLEMIVIDNSSTDGTQEILRRLAAEEPRLKVIVNARNFGHIRSPHHALMQATGDAALAMASDRAAWLRVATGSALDVLPLQQFLLHLKKYST